jgi:predicted dehydrogenase
MIQVSRPVVAAVGAAAGAAEEPLRAELRSFLAAVRGRSRPIASFADARDALAVALDILSAIQKHSQRIQLPSLR